MSRNLTPRESYYGKPPGIERLASLWNKDLVDRLLQLVWKAYDELAAGFFEGVDWSKKLENIERSITQEVERALQNIMRQNEPFLPVHIQHGPFEEETRSSAQAQPPEYDIAFCWNENPLVMWPLEAKVLQSDANTTSNLGDYISTVTERFLECKYAPFSTGAAMLGYLRAGNPDHVAGHIEARLGVSLQSYPPFSDRQHRISDHVRTVPAGKKYPAEFCCHHLVMVLTSSSV